MVLTGIWMKVRFPRRTALASAVRSLALLLMLGLCATTSGCLNYIMVLGYLIGGPPSIEPAFDQLTKESMTDKGVTVAVICYAPTEIRFGFEKIDHELAKYVTYKLKMNKIDVVEPDRVKAWLDQNKDWDRPEELGAAFKCTYVIYIELKKFSLYEEGSANLYRGRAETICSVWKMDKDHETADKIFNKEVISKYPLLQPISTSDDTYSNFKGRYLTRLSEDIGRLFYEYYNGDDMSDGG